MELVMKKSVSAACHFLINKRNSLGLSRDALAWATNCLKWHLSSCAMYGIEAGKTRISIRNFKVIIESYQLSKEEEREFLRLVLDQEKIEMATLMASMTLREQQAFRILEGLPKTSWVLVARSLKKRANLIKSTIS